MLKYHDQLVEIRSVIMLCLESYFKQVVWRFVANNSRKIVSAKIMKYDQAMLFLHFNFLMKYDESLSSKLTMEHVIVASFNEGAQ